MAHTAVVYIITKLELGGAQKVCLSLFKQCTNNTITTFLITGSDGPLVQEVQNNTHVIFVEELTREISFFSFLKELKSFLKIIRHLRKIKKQYQCVIVHTHSTKAGLLGRWAALIARIPTRIHTVHGFGFNDFQPRIIWFIIYILELVTSYITTTYICVSQADIETGTRLFPRFNARLIRAAVEHKKFIPACKTNVIIDTNTPFIFGTVACFKKQKNLFDLLQAFERVYQTHAQAHLEIIGDGALRQELETWLNKHTLTHVVTLHGWQNNVIPIMRRWHSFVLTSLWEGLPCAVIEARLLQLPVISYKTGGVPEVIHDHANGFLCEQKDWISCAQSMLKIIEQPTLHQRLSTHKDNFYDFQENVMITQHIHMYQFFIPHSPAQK